MNITKKLILNLKIHYYKKQWKQNNPGNYVSFGTINKNYFVDDVKNKKYIVGKNTYGKLNILSSGGRNEKLTIGNNCSISGSAEFLLGGNHEYNCLTMYPYKNKLFNESEAITKGPIIIEDEVWIGDRAFILSGVKIEKGAIVAARKYCN